MTAQQDPELRRAGRRATGRAARRATGPLPVAPGAVRRPLPAVAEPPPAPAAGACCSASCSARRCARRPRCCSAPCSPGRPRTPSTGRCCTRSSAATPTPAARAGQPAPAGAWWPRSWRPILLGRYPYEEQWRPATVAALLLGLVAASGWPRFWRPALAVAWAAVLVAVLVLMRGGVLGLPPVPTTRWGGLPLTLMLAIGRHRLRPAAGRGAGAGAALVDDGAAHRRARPTSSCCAACR